MRKLYYLLTILYYIGLTASANSATHKNFDSLSGSLFFHRYSTYDALDSKLFMLDFPSLKLIELSKQWDIIHPMNAHPSKDGKYLTFMGMRSADKKWSIFLWNLDPASHPTNLTGDNFWRNEDPKFSYDSKKIIFKCDGDLCLYNLDNKELKVILSSNKEISMPFWHPTNNGIVFATGARSTSNLEYFDLGTETVRDIYTVPEVSEYYPITFNKNRFYYIRWRSSDNLFDQIYFGYFSGRNPKRLALNKDNVNSSDPCKVNRYLLFFSRHSHEAGVPATGYDLYLADRRYSQINKLPIPVNSPQEELGCFFHRKRFLYQLDKKIKVP